MRQSSMIRSWRTRMLPTLSVSRPLSMAVFNSCRSMATTSATVFIRDNSKPTLATASVASGSCRLPALRLDANLKPNMSIPDAASPVPSPAQSFAPRDPETFFRAQKRNRRATWRMSALGVFAACIMGLPLTLTITPLFYAATLVMAQIIDYFSPIPPEFWQNVNDIGLLAQRVGDYFINHRGTLDSDALTWAIALFLLPGMLIAFGLWMTTVVLFRRGGIGGALASMNAREPNQADLKELQLADVVQEMAIAAGVAAPRVMLVDSPGANAAAIGTSAADARIVLS